MRAFCPPLIFFRFGSFLYHLRVPLLPKLIAWVNRILFATVLPCSAIIGSDVTLGYWGLGIVIHKDAIIGNKCWIHQNVTIGRKHGFPGVPECGVNVTVGAGAVLIGNIKLGDNCVVGANSVVLSDVPANTVVVGAPAKCVRECDPSNSNDRYLER